MAETARFEEVYSAHAPSVLRYCAYSTGSRHVAEDVAAETFARYLEKGARVPAEKTEAWLIHVARNLCASHHRSVVRGRLLTARVAETTPVSRDAWTDPGAWEYVARLKENERLAIYLRIVEERSFADVARIIGKSESATKMTFYRAVDRLRADMLHDGFDRAESVVGGAEYV